MGVKLKKTFSLILPFFGLLLVGSAAWSAMKGYFKHFILVAEFSFLGALILCARDSFRWRKFKAWGGDEEEHDSSVQAKLESATPWWQIALGILFAVPLFIVLLPVMVGALPAMLVAVFVARARWNWRIIYRALRRRRAIMPTFESFFIAPFATFWRWRSRRTRPRELTL